VSQPFFEPLPRLSQSITTTGVRSKERFKLRKVTQVCTMNVIFQGFNEIEINIYVVKSLYKSLFRESLGRALQLKYVPLPVGW